MPRVVAALVIAAGLLVGPAALAHDMWIVPSAFGAQAGERLDVRLHVGHPGSAEVYRRDPRRIVRFTAGGPGQRHALPGEPGGDPAGGLRLDRAGTWVVAYESTVSLHEMPASRFESYLAEEGLDAIAALRRKTGESDHAGRELYRRSLKSLVHAGPGPVADRAVGLPLEIVVEEFGPSGEEQAVLLRVLYHGRPVQGVAIDAGPLNGRGPVRRARSDGAGRLRLVLAPGEWLFSGVHMVRWDGGLADWESIWTSLTLRLPARRHHVPRSPTRMSSLDAS